MNLLHIIIILLRLIFIRRFKLVTISFTFDNNCVGHDLSTIDVAPASVAGDARRAADVLHPEPEAREARRLHRNLQGSRCLLRRRKKFIFFGTNTRD